MVEFAALVGKLISSSTTGPGQPGLAGGQALRLGSPALVRGQSDLLLGIPMFSVRGRFWMILEGYGPVDPGELGLICVYIHFP